jgi:hypothetical protein
MEKIVEKYIDKFAELNPVAATSVIFTFFFLFFALKMIHYIYKIHKDSIEEIKYAFDYSVTTLKSLIESNNKGDE